MLGGWTMPAYFFRSEPGAAELRRLARRASSKRQVAETVGSSSHMTHRWRDMDSNSRSPVSGETLERLVIGSPAIIFRENSWPSIIAARNTAEA